MHIEYLAFCANPNPALGNGWALSGQGAVLQWKHRDLGWKWADETSAEQLQISAQNKVFDRFVSGSGPLNPNFKVTKSSEFKIG